TRWQVACARAAACASSPSIRWRTGWPSGGCASWPGGAPMRPPRSCGCSTSTSWWRGTKNVNEIRGLARRSCAPRRGSDVRPELGLGPVVELPGGGRPRGIGVGGFLLALVTAGALAHVAVRLKGIEVAYDLGRERRINTELEEQRRRLHIEIGMLKDPVRVVELARDKLHM